jgi:hypothetical protein
MRRFQIHFLPPRCLAASHTSQPNPREKRAPCCHERRARVAPGQLARVAGHPGPAPCVVRAFSSSYYPLSPFWAPQVRRLSCSACRRASTARASAILRCPAPSCCQSSQSAMSSACLSGPIFRVLCASTWPPSRPFKAILATRRRLRFVICFYVVMLQTYRSN